MAKSDYMSEILKYYNKIEINLDNPIELVKIMKLTTKFLCKNNEINNEINDLSYDISKTILKDLSVLENPDSDTDIKKILLSAFSDPIRVDKMKEILGDDSFNNFTKFIIEETNENIVSPCNKLDMYKELKELLISLDSSYQNDFLRMMNTLERKNLPDVPDIDNINDKEKLNTMIQKKLRDIPNNVPGGNGPGGL